MPGAKIELDLLSPFYPSTLSLSLSLARPFARSLPSNVKTNKEPSKSILCVFQVDVSDGCRLLMAKKKRKKRKNDNSIVKGNEPEDNKRRERETQSEREREGETAECRC